MEHLPFSRVHLVFGDPMEIPAELSREELEASRASVQDALLRASQQAAREAGVEWPD